MYQRPKWKRMLLPPRKTPTSRCHAY
jgi:hypothetical protein